MSDRVRRIGVRGQGKNIWRGRIGAMIVYCSESQWVTFSFPPLGLMPKSEVSEDDRLNLICVH